MTALALQPPFAIAFGRSPKMPMNEAQFEAFYRANAGGVWSYIYRLTANASTADDLLQKTFFRFLRTNPTRMTNICDVTCTRRRRIWFSIISARRNDIAG